MVIILGLLQGHKMILRFQAMRPKVKTTYLKVKLMVIRH